MSNWKDTILAECVDVINGYAFKSGDFLSEQVEGSLPVLKIKNVANGDVHIDGVQYHLYDESLSKVLIKNKDTLLALTGNHPDAKTQVVGQASRYKLKEPSLLNQRVAKLQAKDGIHPDFLYYFMKDSTTHDYLASHSSGSANQANISKGTVENTPISLPPIEEQEAIAELLCGLDDKIDLLHKENQKLEELAEILYRQWFIVEAGLEGEEVFLSDVADHHKKNIKPFENPFQEYFHYSIPAFDDGQNPQVELGSTILSNKYQVLTNSILISKLNPRFPRVWQISKSIDEEVSICSTEFQVVVPREQRWFTFIYYFVKSRPVTDELIGAAGGTSGSHQRVSPDDIFNLSFIKPDDNKLSQFHQIVSPNLEKINNNREQILKLEKLRNTLLPKLMSGEVRVKM